MLSLSRRSLSWISSSCAILLEHVLSSLPKWPVYMAQLNLNTRMRGTENEAFMLWTVDPSEADMVVVIMEGVAEVAMDAMVAVETN